MPLYPDDSTSTIAATPSRRASSEGNIGKSKRLDIEQGNPLANYVVPVLPKDVKTALTTPPSKWTQFRVWYNPYRQVRLAPSILFVPLVDSNSAH